MPARTRTFFQYTKKNKETKGRTQGETHKRAEKKILVLPLKFNFVSMHAQIDNKATNNTSVSSQCYKEMRKQRFELEFK